MAVAEQRAAHRPLALPGPLRHWPIASANCWPSRSGRSLCDIVTEPQAIFDLPVLSPADAAEIAMRWDLPKDWAVGAI